MINEDKIKKWLAGELSGSEKEEFEKTEEFGSIDKLLKAVNNFKAPEYNADNEYIKLSDRVVHVKRTISLYERISPVLKIAAIFIITLTIGYLSYNYINTGANNQEWIAETPEIYLPDSSFVMVNSGSQISFIQKKWNTERNVELNGEAFFKVKKGSRFNVITQQGTVTVLGTEFGVKDWEDYYEVSCYSGLVKVIANSKVVVLKPNMVYRILYGEEQQYAVTNNAMPDWIKGESSFRSLPLSFVIKELERQFSVKIEAKSINTNQLFSGSFSNNNLEIALESVTIPLNLYYEMHENKIVISIEKK